MLQRFNYDKKKARKAYRYRCWTEYWYLSITLIFSLLGFCYSCLNGKIGLIFVFVFISISVIRNNLARRNCKVRQNVDITNEHLIIRWTHQEDTFGYDSNLDSVQLNSRKIKKKIVVPLESISNLILDNKSKRITFDYMDNDDYINKNESGNICHMVMYDVYDMSLIDELKKFNSIY